MTKQIESLDLMLGFLLKLHITQLCKSLNSSDMAICNFCLKSMLKCHGQNKVEYDEAANGDVKFTDWNKSARSQ